MSEPNASKSFWNKAAKENAAWYIATAHDAQSPEFFASGAAEVDEYLSTCRVPSGVDKVVLEIGCGVGRMTHRLAERFGHVVAVDVSSEMLKMAAGNLPAGRVDLIEVAGDGSLPGADRSLDAVFSYITLQHVPSIEHQFTYLSESARLLKVGGVAAIQVRSGSTAARVVNWVGHIGHLVRGRSTVSRAWRGATLSQSEVERRLRSPELVIEFLQLSRRHVWIRLERVA